MHPSSVTTESRRTAPDHPHIQHTNLGTTSQGIDNAEIIETVHGRRVPVIPAATALGP
jgi:hypothetical protein